MENTSKTTEEKTFTANEVGSMLERIDNSVKILAESMDIKFESVNNRLNGIDNKLELVDTKIDRLQDDMVEVKFELKRKVAADEYEKLEKRVVKLEKLSLAH